MTKRRRKKEKNRFNRDADPLFFKVLILFLRLKQRVGCDIIYSRMLFAEHTVPGRMNGFRCFARPDSRAVRL